MSKPVVIEIIERAIDNDQYRTQLLNDPDTALAGYELTNDEKQRLSGLSEGSFDDFAGPLTGRTTKGQWIPGG
jgi:hypothetical protein